jgi:hypothetical protein
VTGLRIVAVLLALSLMIGELWRSFGAGRPLVFVIDDPLMGALLLAGAWAVREDTLRRRALFAGAWGVNVGMLYGSFFGKLVAPEQTDAGNWDLGVLTLLVGVAFAVACAGLAASIALTTARRADIQR